MKFEAYEVSSVQKRIFLVEQLQGKSTLYNIPGARIIEGDLEPLRLKEAIKKLIRRHEAPGTPAAGRSHPELEGVVGMFVNMLVLRNQPTPAKSFKKLLGEVSHRALLAYQNQDYPFEMLVEKLGLERHLNRNPLFDTAFALNNYSHEEGAVKELGNLKFIPYSVQYRNSKCDFSLAAYKAGQNIVLRTIYRTSLFKEESMKRFTNHYAAIFSGKNLPPLRCRYSDYSEW